jgi:DNA-binding beta-propeller fold protein YncE
MVCAAALAAVLGAVLPARAGAPHWHLEKTVRLGSPDRWDFVYLDPAGNRVYVAHEDKISVVDPRAGRLVGVLEPIAGAHDIALVPSVGRLYAGNGRTGMVSVFDAKTLKRLGEIAAKPDTDAIAYDSTDGVVIVADGDSGFATLIDPAHDKVTATIAIGPGAEGIASDGAGHAFVNISDGGEMVRLDLKRGVVDRHWPLKGCESPHGLAMDRQTARLFVSCRNMTMLVVDSMSGRIVAKLPIGRGTDSAAFDPKRKLAFSANKDGTISAIAELSRDRYEPLAPIRTSPGAATMAEDPRTGRIYVVTAKVANELPPHHNGEVPEYRYRPGTVRLLIFRPDS